MYQLTAQGLGILATVIRLIVYHFKTPRNVLFVKLSANILWTVHYLMIGAITAFSTAIICDVREFVYAVDTNEKRRKGWLLAFIICCGVTTAITWQGAASLLPGTATALSTYSFFQRDVSIIAVIFTLMMLVYDIIVRSYPGIVSQLISLGSITAAILRFRNDNTAEVCR